MASVVLRMSLSARLAWPEACDRAPPTVGERASREPGVAPRQDDHGATPYSSLPASSSFVKAASVLARARKRR